MGPPGGPKTEYFPTSIGVPSSPIALGEQDHRCCPGREDPSGPAATRPPVTTILAFLFEGPCRNVADGRPGTLDSTRRGRQHENRG